MNYEDQIRFKHASEDALSRYISYLSVMSDREIELCIAKLADQLDSFPDTELKQLLQLKGYITTEYLKLRSAMRVTQRNIFRQSYRIELQTYCIQLAEKKYNEEKKKEEKQHLYVRRERYKIRDEHKLRVKKWHSQIAKLSTWGRLFKTPKKPTMPSLPEYPKDDIPYGKILKEVKSELTLGDYLVYAAINQPIPHASHLNDTVDESKILEISQNNA